MWHAFRLERPTSERKVMLMDFSPPTPPPPSFRQRESRGFSGEIAIVL